MLMQADPGQHPDAVDILIKIAIFVCFIVFAFGVWLIRKERDNRKNERR